MPLATKPDIETTGKILDLMAALRDALSKASQPSADSAVPEELLDFSRCMKGCIRADALHGSGAVAGNFCILPHDEAARVYDGPRKATLRALQPAEGNRPEPDEGDSWCQACQLFTTTQPCPKCKRTSTLVSGASVRDEWERAHRCRECGSKNVPLKGQTVCAECLDKRSPGPAESGEGLPRVDGRALILMPFQGPHREATAADLAAVLAAMPEERREKLLTPFAGELGEALLREQAARHRTNDGRVAAEQRAEDAGARVSLMKAERDAQEADKHSVTLLLQERDAQLSSQSAAHEAEVAGLRGRVEELRRGRFLAQQAAIELLGAIDGADMVVEPGPRAQRLQEAAARVRAFERPTGKPCPSRWCSKSSGHDDECDAALFEEPSAPTPPAATLVDLAYQEANEFYGEPPPAAKEGGRPTGNEDAPPDWMPTKRAFGARMPSGKPLATAPEGEDHIPVELKRRTPGEMRAYADGIEEARKAHPAHLLLDSGGDTTGDHQSPPSDAFVVKLICCGRDDGTFGPCGWDQAESFRKSYLDADGHQRSGIICRAPDVKKGPPDEQRKDPSETAEATTPGSQPVESVPMGVRDEPGRAAYPGAGVVDAPIGSVPPERSRGGPVGGGTLTAEDAEDGARRMYERAMSLEEPPWVAWPECEEETRAFWTRAYRFAHSEGAQAAKAKVGERVAERVRAAHVRSLRLAGWLQGIRPFAPPLGAYAAITIDSVRTASDSAKAIVSELESLAAELETKEPT